MTLRTYHRIFSGTEPTVFSRCVLMCFHWNHWFFKVALFKSMAAAVDWANSLDITSGSFQVAEVAPAMRRAFEREVRIPLGPCK